MPATSEPSRARGKFDRPARDAEKIAAAHVPKRGSQLLSINSLTHRR